MKYLVNGVKIYHSLKRIKEIIKLITPVGIEPTNSDPLLLNLEQQIAIALTTRPRCLSKSTMRRFY